MLTNNGGNDLRVTRRRLLRSSREQVASGSKYDVRVAGQPSNPTQTCSVAPGTGAGHGGHRADHQRGDHLQHQHLHGRRHVSNLVGSGLVLQNNGVDDLRIDAGGDIYVRDACPERRDLQRDDRHATCGPTQECTIVANGTGTAR